MSRTRRERTKPPPLDENTLNLRELAEFVDEGPRFLLGLATYDVPETRDTYLRRLSDMVADRPVHLTRLDLSRSSREELLLRRLREHLAANPAAEGKHPAIMVVGLEATIDFHRTPDGHRAVGGPLLHNANFQRDAFPKSCPAPVVLWLSPPATTAFGQSAPDLWHWRSGSFTFTGSPEARVRIERDLITTPSIERSNLAPERKRERIGMLRDLLAELEMAEDCETPGNQARRAAILFELGLTFHQLSEPMTAIKYFNESLALYRAIGDRHGEEYALGNLGLAYYSVGQVERAISFFGQALAIARAIGDRRGEGGALGNLGSAYAELSQVERAIESFEQRLAIARAIGDRRGEGGALGNLGSVYYSLGQFERAIGSFEQHVEIARAIGDRRGEGHALGSLGSAYAAFGQVERALHFFEQHVEIARAIGDRCGEGHALGNLGIAYAALGQVERATSLFEQALRIGRDIQDPRIIAFATSQLERWQGAHVTPPDLRKGSGSRSSGAGEGEAERARGSVDD